MHRGRGGESNGWQAERRTEAGAEQAGGEGRPQKMLTGIMGWKWEEKGTSGQQRARGRRSGAVLSRLERRSLARPVATMKR